MMYIKWCYIHYWKNVNTELFFSVLKKMPWKTKQNKKSLQSTLFRLAHCQFFLYFSQRFQVCGILIFIYFYMVSEGLIVYKFTPSTKVFFTSVVCKVNYSFCVYVSHYCQDPLLMECLEILFFHKSLLKTAQRDVWNPWPSWKL